MTDFRVRQDDLRKDLHIILLQQYGGNRTALSDSLEIVPKVLRDFIDRGVYMQSAKYDKIIQRLLKFNLPVVNLDLGGLVKLLNNIDANNSANLETIFNETFDPRDVERFKLIHHFLHGGPLENIRNFDILKKGPSGDEYSGSFAEDNFKGFLKVIGQNFEGDSLKKHEKLSDFSYAYNELRNNFASYMFGYRAPSYFLDKLNTPKAILLYIVGERFKSINEKVLRSLKEGSKPKLSVDDLIYCNNLSYNYDTNEFLRSCGNFLTPAKASENKS